jgi:hypothetical protein
VSAKAHSDKKAACWHLVSERMPLRSGPIVTLALPSVVAAAESGNLSVGGVVSQLIAGGTGGAILTAIIGAIKNKAIALAKAYFDFDQRRRLRSCCWNYRLARGS